MPKADPYQILGVSERADDQAIKNAYRKLAMKYHPDRNPDDARAEAKFKEVGEAYEILKDPDKRSAYDRYGHAAFEGGMGGAGGGQGAAGFGSFSDLFEEMFNMGGGDAGSSRGQHRQVNVQLSLEDVFKGRTVDLKIKRMDRCSACDGTGADSPDSIVKCGTCNGMGKVRMSQGFFTLEQTCPHCRGRGHTIRYACRTCHGQGVVEQKQSISVRIPPGVADGNRIRVAGKGDAGPAGAVPGDLYITVSVIEHEIFKRHGDHLTCELPVSVISAMLGGELQVPTIDGTMNRIKIHEGTQSGQQFRLRGKGMHKLNSSQRGDMYVHIQLETPVNLTQSQKTLLREFEQESERQQQMPTSQRFFTKVRELWKDLAG
ncbi:MAG: molecular chaperone DnaJ [Pseudomonadota bacterium]